VAADDEVGDRARDEVGVAVDQGHVDVAAPHLEVARGGAAAEAAADDDDAADRRTRGRAGAARQGQAGKCEAGAEQAAAREFGGGGMQLAVHVAAPHFRGC
jgi:hypothetical protein